MPGRSLVWKMVPLKSTSGVPKPNKKDLDLIFLLADKAVASAINGENGVVGWDEENKNTLSCINFNRIK